MLGFFMGRLVEDLSFRNRLQVFKDRKEAGRLLSKYLLKYKGSDGLILGIPSGGVPLASEIADALHLPMDLIIVRKIQLPYNPEAGFGAMGPDGEILLNEKLLKQLDLTEEEIDNQVKKTNATIGKRNEIFRGKKPFPNLSDKIVIVADDGLASGYTMFAAIKFLKRKNPWKIIVSVPTGSEKTVNFILPYVDELVCLNVRSGFSFAVADAYKNWYDLSDEEVLNIIEAKGKQK
jgi:putative phosphoribosyl transferase